MDSYGLSKPGTRDLFAKRQNPRPSRSSTFQANAIFVRFFWVTFLFLSQLLFTLSALFPFWHFFFFITFSFLALFLVFLTCSLSLVYFIIYYVYLQRRQRFCTTSGNFPSYHLLYLSLFSHHVSLSVTFHPPCDRSGKRASTVLTWRDVMSNVWREWVSKFQPPPPFLVPSHSNLSSTSAHPLYRFYYILTPFPCVHAQYTCPLSIHDNVHDNNVVTTTVFRTYSALPIRCPISVR